MSQRIGRSYRIIAIKVEWRIHNEDKKAKITLWARTYQLKGLTQS